MKDRSPDITNLTYHLNCSDDDRYVILDYDSRKFALVDQAIPIMTIIFSIIGIIINGIFIYLTIRGIRDRKLPFKGYSLLLNRSITDVLTSFLTLIFVSLHRFDQEPDPTTYPTEYENKTFVDVDYVIPHGRTVFTLLLTLDFWAAAGCYAVLALFTYFAVRYPIIYKIHMTNRRCIYVGVIIWLLGLFYAVLVVCISPNNAFNVFNNDALIQWTVSTSDFVLSISNLFIVLLSFTIVCFSYFFIIAYLCRVGSQSGTLASHHLLSIGRIGLNVFAFAISCFVMAGFVSIPLFLKHRIDQLNGELGDMNPCRTVIDTYHLGYSMALWTTVAMAGWQIRMVIDPVANIGFDQRFKLLWDEMCCVPLAGLQPRYSLRSDAGGEFLRKCVAQNVIPISVITGEGRYFRFRTASNVDDIDVEKGRKRRKVHRRFEDMQIDRHVL